MKLGREIMPCHQRLMAKYQKHNRENPTETEKRIGMLLYEIGEPFIFEKGFFTYNSFYLTDFYLPKPRKICLEIDGPIHEHRVSYDNERDAFLMRVRKIRAILRIKNHEALHMTCEQLKNLISQY